MLNINNFKNHLPAELLLEAIGFVLNNNIVKLTEDDDGCYNAVIRVNGVEYDAEVTLDASANIEDAYCPLCGPTLCAHTTAMCFAIELMRCLGVDSLDEMMDAVADYMKAK